MDQCKAANKHDDPCQTFKNYILTSSSPTRTLYSLEVTTSNTFYIHVKNIYFFHLFSFIIVVSFGVGLSLVVVIYLFYFSIHILALLLLLFIVDPVPVDAFC